MFRYVSLFLCQVNTINLPSPTELYHQCAVTLLNAGRYEDTVTVCDKVLTTAVGGEKPAEKGMGDFRTGRARYHNHSGSFLQSFPS